MVVYFLKQIAYLLQKCILNSYFNYNIYEIIIKLDYKSLNDQGLLTVDENFDSDSNWSMHLYNIQLTSN